MASNFPRVIQPCQKAMFGGTTGRGGGESCNLPLSSGHASIQYETGGGETGVIYNGIGSPNASSAVTQVACLRVRL